MAENTPRELVVAVVTVPLPLNVMVTSESGSKLMPIIFTGVPTGPEVSLSPMIGFSGGEDVTVNVVDLKKIRHWQ